MEDIKQADELGKQEDESFDWLTDPAVILHDQELQHYGYQRFSTHESRRKQRYFAPSRRVKVTER